MLQKILLVEDEKNIAESLVFNLEHEYDVVWAETGEKALKEWGDNQFDLIVLDVMLPRLSGFDVCKTIRQEDVQTPILFLTAKNQERDRIEGFQIGGDDYLGKPFNLDEFLLRVKALIRRSQRTPIVSAELPNHYHFGLATIDFENYEATANGQKIPLTKKECLLMKLLIENEGQVVTRDEILSKVWGYETLPSTRTIDNFIVKLRSYFEPNPKEPRFIHSIRGVGYKFTKSE
ncbi:response regulator transcription factor [bacterium]|nr:response regulator transcription factor [bacterium]